MSDFGLSKDMYATNYYRHIRKESADDEKIPIRWMAPESVQTDVYNESTDVVSHS